MVESNKEIHVNTDGDTTIDRFTLSRMVDSLFETRDFDKIFGYNKNPKASDYLNIYKRQNIAERIIDAYPSATWSNPPIITDTPETKEDSPFDVEVKEFFKKHKLFQVLHRADKLTQLGRFSILVIGTKDGQPLSSPITKGAEIAYFKSFGEKDVIIHEIESDMSSERYGLPTVYKVTIEDPSQTGLNKTREVMIHHSRCKHLAEGRLDSEIYGKPRLESIIDNLFDLRKVVGGSSEMFWMNGRGGLVASADKDTVIADPDGLKKNFDDYGNSLTRTIRVQGMDVKPLNVTVPDPKPHFEIIVSLISGATGIPQRILLGSERGQLASSQDKGNWQDRVDERRINYSEPDVLRELVDFLMELGALTMTDYEVQWPDLGEPDEKSIADTAQKRATALSSYVNSPSANKVITEQQFVENILQMEYLIDDIEKDEGYLVEEEIIRDESTETDDGLPNHAEPKEN